MVMGVAQFERLFRHAASLDIDKSDLRRLEDFINEELHSLLLMAQRLAKMNGRDVITRADVPLTKGLQQSMHEFRELNEEVPVKDILERLAKLPPLDLAIGAEVEEMLPELAGGMVISLARVFRVIDPDMKNPQTEHWEKVRQIYELLV